MWTPKRVLLLFGGFALFWTGYGVYAYFLGGIDGLPPLPDGFCRPAIAADLPALPAEGSGDVKLQTAFGKGCLEVYRPIKVDLPSKGWGMAADQFAICKDGRVKLHPFSGYLFPKGKPWAKYPEVHAVQCEEAFLTFDRPVTSLSEMSNRKVIGIELQGKQGITIVNNRGTMEKSDDIWLRITNAPLFYDERRNLIWTEGYIQLLDMQNQPHPTQITAKGLDLFLTKDAVATQAKNQGKPAGPKGKGDEITGVEMLVLRCNVDMHLYIEAQSGFLGSPPEGEKTKPAAHKPGPAAKEKIVINTNGPFTYDLTREIARFDSPALQAQETPISPEQVLVAREHKIENHKTSASFAASLLGLLASATPYQGICPTLALPWNRSEAKKYDHLLCDHLELHFRRKPRTGPNRGIDKEIETAQATARPGKEVVLTMDTENLEAFAAEMFFRSATATSGPQTILKGNPVHAVKDAHKIVCRELHLIGADKNGNGQQAFAKGPGQIDLFNKSNPQRPYPVHALWKHTLTTTKDKENNRLFELLTLTGDACFIDEEHKQQLQGQRLQVWLEAADKASLNESPPEKQRAMGAPRHQLVKVDAFERVTALAPEMMVKRANHLRIHFKNDIPTGDKLPDVPPSPNVTRATSTVYTTLSPIQVDEPAPPGKPAMVSGAEPSTRPTGAPMSQADQGPSIEPEKSAKAKARPTIELEANEIVAYVIRTGTKNQLQELLCEGSVHVHQDGDQANEKGLDIKGDLLNLLHHPQGDILTVFGASTKPAQLQLGEMVLVGPKATINQRDNMAEVEGTGAMTLPPSSTTFDGRKPTKPGTRLTVHWNDNMLFNGKYADFHGGVVAYQDHSSLRCHTLQVVLDRVVSFKEGQKGSQKPKVEKLVCNKKVYVLDEFRDAQGQIVRYHRLETRELTMDNQEGPIIATGPGKLYLLGRGSVDSPRGSSEPGVSPVPPTHASQEPRLHLARIDFEGRMFSTNKDNNRLSKFYDNVEVFHLPTDNPDVEVNPDHPPKGGFYLRCDLLTVYTKNLPNGKMTQEMRGERRVFFRTQEFFGRAEVVKYDQSQEVVIFEGSPGNPTTLWQIREGLPPREIKGQKILFNRRTGVFQLDGGQVITSWLGDCGLRIADCGLRISASVFLNLQS